MGKGQGTRDEERVNRKLFDGYFNDLAAWWLIFSFSPQRREDARLFFINELHKFPRISLVNELFWSANYANLREVFLSTNYTNLNHKR